MFSEQVEFTFELLKQRLVFFSDRKVFKFDEHSNEISLIESSDNTNINGQPSLLLDFF